MITSPFLLLLSSLLFNSKGPIILCLLGAILLAIRFTGIQFMNDNTKEMPSWMVTRFGSFVIVHCHHNKELCEKGKEFKFKGKYFCTGCYGLCLGTVISIIIIILYLIYGLSSVMIVPLICLIPFLLIPIILRYLIFIHMKSSLRFLSNTFFPIGLVLLLSVIDRLLKNWIINSIFVFSLIGIAYLRWKIALLDDVRLLKVTK